MFDIQVLCVDPSVYRPVWVTFTCMGHLFKMVGNVGTGKHADLYQYDKEHNRFDPISWNSNIGVMFAEHWIKHYDPLNIARK